MSKTPSEPDAADLDPKQLKRLAKAVSRALRRLDEGLAGQRAQIVEMAEAIVAASVKAVAAARKLEEWPDDDAPALDDAVLEQLTSVVRASFASLQVEPARPEELDELAAAAERQARGEETPAEQLAHAAVAAVSMGWANAVTAHQQQAALAEAALTQGLTMLFSLAGDALTEKQEIRLDTLAHVANPESDFDETYDFSESDGDDEDDDEDW